MNDFWNQVVFGNPIKKYLLIVAVIVGVIILKKFLAGLIANLLFRFVKKVASGVDQTSFVGLVRKPIEIFLVVFAATASIEKMRFPEELDFEIYEVSSKAIVHAIATSILIIGFIWLLLRIIDFVAIILQRKANATGDLRDHQLIVFFRDFLKVIIGIVGLLMIMSFAFGTQISNILATFGLAGAALALAAKESIENLIASFIIFFDKPFTAGDVVKVQGYSGTIEKIGLRSTRIRTEVKTYVTVPNKQMVDSIVDNLTLRTQRKAEIRLQIGVSTSPSVIAGFIDGISKIIRKDNIENPTVFLNDIASNALLVNVDYFTAPIALADFNQLKQRVNMEILQLMEALQIEISGASMDIRIARQEGINAETNSVKGQS